MLTNVAIQTAGPAEIYKHIYEFIYLVIFDYSRGKKYFSTPQSPNLLWGSLSLIPNGFRGSFREGKAVWGVNLTMQHQLFPR
jgi:hypothetical protein